MLAMLRLMLTHNGAEESARDLIAQQRQLARDIDLLRPCICQLTGLPYAGQVAAG